MEIIFLNSLNKKIFNINIIEYDDDTLQAYMKGGNKILKCMLVKASKLLMRFLILKKDFKKMMINNFFPSIQERRWENFGMYACWIILFYNFFS